MPHVRSARFAAFAVAWVVVAPSLRAAPPAAVVLAAGAGAPVVLAANAPAVAQVADTGAPAAQAVPAAPAAPVTQAVRVTEAWARASAGASTTGAAYVTLVGGAQADSLVSVSTPIATTADVHETTSDNGVSRMRAVPAVAIPPGRTVTFAPGGFHIMLTGLKQRLTAGQSFPLTLTFAHAAPVTVAVQVRPLGHGAATGGHDTMMPMGGHDDMKMQ
jgi:copper(I)-binding protein